MNLAKGKELEPPTISEGARSFAPERSNDVLAATLGNRVLWGEVRWKYREGRASGGWGMATVDG